MGDWSRFEHDDLTLALVDLVAAGVEVPRSLALIDLRLHQRRATRVDRPIDFPSARELAVRWGWWTKTGRPSEKRVKTLWAGEWEDPHYAEAWAAYRSHRWPKRFGAVRPKEPEGPKRDQDGTEEGPPEDQDDHEQSSTNRETGPTEDQRGTDEGPTRDDTRGSQDGNDTETERFPQTPTGGFPPELYQTAEYELADIRHAYKPEEYAAAVERRVRELWTQESARFRTLAEAAEHAVAELRGRRPELVTSTQLSRAPPGLVDLVLAGMTGAGWSGTARKTTIKQAIQRITA